MDTKFSARMALPRSSYCVNVNISDEALETYSVEELRNAISRAGFSSKKPVLVRFSINNQHSLLTYCEFFRRIDMITAGNVEVKICTGGKNFNKLMDAIRTSNRSNNYSVYIDDHDIQQVLNESRIDWSKVSCRCHLSRRYVRNLDDDSFRYVYSEGKYLFDRNKSIDERRIICEVWYGISPVTSAINKLTPLAKTVLIADFINGNISYADDGHSLFGQTSDGRNIHSVEEWASDGVLTYEKRRGVCSGQSDLASILLDNYLAKTNCRCVSGFYQPFNDSHEWISVLINGKNYGVCLTLRKRFVDLSRLNYLEGNISLDIEHSNRNDYEINISSYENISRESYDAFRTDVYRILKELQKNEGKGGLTPPPLPPRRESGPSSLPPRRESGPSSLPPRRESRPPSLPPRRESGSSSLPPRRESRPSSLPPRREDIESMLSIRSENAESVLSSKIK